MAKDRGKQVGKSKAGPGRKARKTSFSDVHAVLDRLETDLRADRSHPKSEHLIQMVGAMKELTRVLCLAFSIESTDLEFGPGGLYRD